jgi:hypothetical protein
MSSHQLGENGWIIADFKITSKAYVVNSLFQRLDREALAIRGAPGAAYLVG